MGKEINWFYDSILVFDIKNLMVSAFKWQRVYILAKHTFLLCKMQYNLLYYTTFEDKFEWTAV